MAPRRSAQMLLAAALAMTQAGAGAAEIDYEVGLSVLHSDNIGLAATDTRDETVVSPGVSFSASEAGSRFRLDARGDVQWLHYVDGSYGDGVRGSLTGQAAWTVVEDRLEFVVEDYLSRQPIDTLAAFNPGNEQQANLLVAGPTLYARLGPATRGQLDLRYADSRADENERFDSTRLNAALRVLREIDRTRRVGMNAEATQVDYDLDGGSADYTRYDAYARYRADLRNVDVRADAGYSRVQFDDRPGSEGAPLFRGGLTWHLSPRSDVDIAASHEFSDAAQDLVTLDGGPGNPQVPIEAEVYRTTRVELGYRYTGERFDLAASPYFQRIRYVGESVADTDQDSHGGGLELGWRLRPRTRLALVATRDDRDYGALDRTDREFSAGLQLTTEFTRHWSVRGDLLHRRRGSTAAGQDYDENAAAISVRYRR